MTNIDDKVIRGVAGCYGDISLEIASKSQVGSILLINIDDLGAPM